MPPKRARACTAEFLVELKDKIDELAVPENSHISGRDRGQAVSPSRRFHPIVSLRRLLPMEEVAKVLDHFPKCSACQIHLQGAEAAHPKQYRAEHILQTDNAVNLFALLLKLGYPLLIGCFFVINGPQVADPRYYSSFELMDRYFEHLETRSKQTLADDFQAKKYQFSAPKFTDGSFQRFEEGTILPYMDEEPIGRGSYGKVFKVYIRADYCFLPASQPADSLPAYPQTRIQVFARKEFIRQEITDFLKEKLSLERIASLRDEHLVEIQKTYQLGERFNILLPFAKTNLHDYLRDRKWRAPQLPRISENPLWKQLFGISRALSKIITYADPENHKNTWFGCHSDLKPRNILVDNTARASTDVFKITDFGQADFIDPSSGGSSLISVGGGTDAYAPPESLDLLGATDRKYDVWSLGVIVLEILAFTILGTDGLTDPKTGLDYVRRSNEARYENERLYIGGGSDAKIKLQVRRWMESLVSLAVGEENQRFVQKMLGLICQMLTPKKERIRIERVVELLLEIFNVEPSEDPEISAEDLKEKDEVILVDLKEVEYYPKGLLAPHSRREPFIVLENKKHRLRTLLSRPTTDSDLFKDQRQKMQLILPYQHKKDDSETNTFDIAFASIIPNHEVNLQGAAIVLNDKLVARRVQMALTGHNISDRYELDTLTVKSFRKFGEQAAATFKHGIKNLGKSKAKQDDQLIPEYRPQWIELWIEKRQQVQDLTHPDDNSSMNTSQNRRSKRQVNPGKHVPMGRVAIYCDDRIIIVPFARESALIEQPDMKQMRKREIVFHPMDRRQCEYFPVTQLVAHSGSCPGIPMHYPVLYEWEKEGLFNCERVELKFKYHEGAYEFYKLYRTEKGRWLDETKGKVSAGSSLMPLA